MRFVQFYEECKTRGLRSTVHDMIYLNRDAIILEKELSFPLTKSRSIPELSLSLIEISLQNFNKYKLTYSMKNRYLKTLHYFDKGYKAFAIIRNNEVIGDLWYTTSSNSKQSFIHPDLKWLNIDLGEKDVYTFDIYIKQEERGNRISITFWTFVCNALQRKGFEKVCGYVWADNIPALWLYRMLRWKELKRVKMWRFLFLRRRLGIKH